MSPLFCPPWANINTPLLTLLWSLIDGLGEGIPGYILVSVTSILSTLGQHEQTLSNVITQLLASISGIQKKGKFSRYRPGVAQRVG